MSAEDLVNVSLSVRDLKSIIESDPSLPAMNRCAKALRVHEGRDTIPPQTESLVVAERIARAAIEVSELFEGNEVEAARERITELPGMLHELAALLPESQEDPLDRIELLKRAETAVGHGSPYGQPSAFFVKVAALWSALLGCDIDRDEVAQCLILFKLARLNTAPAHLDSWVDIAGYAAIGAETALQKDEEDDE